MDIALITIWIAVAFVAILLGLALEHRHITGWGWLTAAGGLVLLIASIHWIYPTLNQGKLAVEAVRNEIADRTNIQQHQIWDLGNKLVDAQGRVAAAEKSRVQLEKDYAGAKNANDTAQGRLASAEAALQAANERNAALKEAQQALEKQLAAAKETGAAPQSSATAAQPAPEADAERQAARQRFKGLEEANQQLTKQCAAAKDAENAAEQREAAAQAQVKAEAERYAALNADYERLRTDEAAAKANVRDIEAKLAEAKNVKPRIVRVPEPKDLHKDMDASLFAEYYDIRPLATKELISGKTGSYYVVNLRNAESGNHFIFPGGEYTLGAEETQLKQALGHFASEVVAKLESDHKTVEIFVRGRADKSPMNGRPAIGDPAYRRLMVLNLVGPDRYASSPAEKITGTPVDNRDLPDLRAAYLGKLVNAAIPGANSVILNGAIADDANEYERTASIILWVPW